MSSHSDDKNEMTCDNLDTLIRWTLQDAVTDVEPSPQVWERIRQGVLESEEVSAVRPPARRRLFSRRLWLSWLIGAGAGYPVPGDPRAAWQRRLHPFDMRSSLSIVRIIEGRMPALRVVS